MAAFRINLQDRKLKVFTLIEQVVPREYHINLKGRFLEFRIYHNFSD